MRWEFKETMKETVTGSQVSPESEPVVGDSTEPSNVSPHRLSNCIASIWLTMLNSLWKKGES